jgi:hypothetical protein
LSSQCRGLAYVRTSKLLLAVSKASKSKDHNVLLKKGRKEERKEERKKGRKEERKQ